MPKDSTKRPSASTGRFNNPYVDRDLPADPSGLFGASSSPLHPRNQGNRPGVTAYGRSSRGLRANTIRTASGSRPPVRKPSVSNKPRPASRGTPKKTDGVDIKGGVLQNCPSIKNTNELIDKITIMHKRPRKQVGVEFTRHEEAWFLLHKIASLVFPIMKKHGFRVKQLTEFYRADLLGRNWNHGWKIEIRLRKNEDPNQFLPLHSLLGTMLHELTHNKIGPHNDAFNSYMKGMVDELETMMAKGFTGSGFFSTGRRLGYAPRDINHSRFGISSSGVENTFGSGTGRRLGGPTDTGAKSGRTLGNRTGPPARNNKNQMKQAILQALERRLPHETASEPIGTTSSAPGSTKDTPLTFDNDEELSKLDENDLRILEMNSRPEDYAKIKIEITDHGDDNLEDVVITDIVERDTPSRGSSPAVKKEKEIIDLTDD